MSIDIELKGRVVRVLTEPILAIASIKKGWLIQKMRLVSDFVTLSILSIPAVCPMLVCHRKVMDISLFIPLLYFHPCVVSCQDREL